MTEELKTIMDELDALEHDPDYAEDFCCEESGALITFCEARLFIITEDDWNAIEARGYDLRDWRRDFDESFKDTERNKTVALRIWQRLCKVPFDENTNEIKAFFRGYPKRTDRFEIWSDIEHYYGVDVKKDFMHIDKSEDKKGMKEPTTKIINPENRMTSSGSYLNFWDAMGDYDVFLCFHEMELNTHEELCEMVVRQIMEHRKEKDTREALKNRILTALDALVEWEYSKPCVFIEKMKGEK